MHEFYGLTLTLIEMAPHSGQHAKLKVFSPSSLQHTLVNGKSLQNCECFLEESARQRCIRALDCVHFGLENTFVCD
jgi:hypothetical protein